MLVSSRSAETTHFVVHEWIPRPDDGAFTCLSSMDRYHAPARVGAAAETDIREVVRAAQIKLWRTMLLVGTSTGNIVTFNVLLNRSVSRVSNAHDSEVSCGGMCDV